MFQKQLNDSSPPATDSRRALLTRWTVPLLLLVAFLCSGASTAHAAEFYFKLELKDGTGKVILEWNITVEAADQGAANTAAIAQYESIRTRVCGLTRGAFCRIPYRWDLYPAKKTTTTVCSEQINASGQQLEPFTAPSPACTEVDRFEVVGPPIATSEGAATGISALSLYPSIVR